MASLFAGDKARAQERLDQLGVDFNDRYLKPSQGFTFVGATAMLLFGGGPEALLIVNGIAGLASVALLYCLAAPVFGVPVATAGAALLALSPYHVSYCRTAFTESLTTLTVLIGILFWCRARGSPGGWTAGNPGLAGPSEGASTSKRRIPRRGFFGCGLALGWAAACHYRAAIVPVGLAAWEIGGAAWRRWILRDHDVLVGPRLREWTWALVGALTVLAAIELTFRAARFLAWITDSYLPLLTYLEAAWRWGRVVATDPSVREAGLFHGWVLEAFAEYYRHWHGTVAAALAAFGWIVLLRRSSGLSAVGGMCILLAGTLLFQGVAVVRAISFVVPILCLSTALGAAVLLRGLRHIHPRAASAGAVGLVLALGIPSVSRLAEILPKRSMIADACTFLSAEGGKAAVHHSGIYEAVLSGKSVEFVDGQSFHHHQTPRELLADLRARGVRWVVTDPQIWHYRGWPHIFDWWVEFRTLLQEEAALVAELSHCRDYRWEFLAEGPGLKHLPEMTELDEGSIRIYDLSRLPVAATATPTATALLLQHRGLPEHPTVRLAGP